MLWLVGAGSGDPGQLTVRGRQLLGEATVVLADPSCIALARELGAGAALRPVPPVKDWPQAGGDTVVRLVPGDGIAATVSERAELDRLGVRYDLVPGVEAGAADAVPALLGDRLVLQRPLTGRTVVVSRPEGQQAPLAESLRRLGARVVVMPAIAIVGPDDGGAALAAAAGRLSDYAWVVVTSANGARALLDAAGDLRALAGVRLAAIGPATADVLVAARLRPDLVPARFVAEGLLEEFPSPPSGGGRVLLVRAAVARDTLPDGLRAAGWVVDVVAAYRTVPAEVPPDAVATAGAADAVLVTSPSTVQRLVDLLGADRLAPSGGGPAVVAIGPVTAAAAASLGVRVDAVAERYDVAGLVDALRGWVAATTGPGTGPAVRSAP